MTRRKSSEKNVRNLVKLGGSYAVTLPLETLKKWKWKEKQKVTVEVDEKKKIIVIKDWKKQ